MSADPNAGFNTVATPTKSLLGPWSNADAVTGSDTTSLATTSCALYIGGAGDLVVQMANGSSSVTFSAVPLGILPIRVTKIFATGTHATGVLNLY